MEKKRLNNLEIREATYLGSPPKIKSWHINYWYPNPDYGQEDKYIRKGDFYYSKDVWVFKKHKSCFEHKECCFTIASFNYDSKEPCWELQFIGDRPLCLNKKEREDFWKLVEYGYKNLETIYDSE